MSIWAHPALVHCPHFMNEPKLKQLHYSTHSSAPITCPLLPSLYYILCLPANLFAFAFFFFLVLTILFLNIFFSHQFFFSLADFPLIYTLAVVWPSYFFFQIPFLRLIRHTFEATNYIRYHIARKRNRKYIIIYMIRDNTCDEIYI